MKINIVGTALGNTGYDSHTRQLANALCELGQDVRLDVPKYQGWEQNVNDAELNMLTKPYDRNCFTISITTPPFWRLSLADNPEKFAGFLVWEGDKIPNYWMQYIIDKRVDYIFVPSQHTKDAILRTMTEMSDLIGVNWKGSIHNWNKIKIFPHGVDMSLFNVNVLANQKADKLTFLMNKGWSRGIKDRGGIQWGLKAFSEAFSNKDNIQLKIKINSTYNALNWDFIEEFKKLKFDSLFREDKPYMMVNKENIVFKDIPKFYAEGQVFMSLTMGEAFNLPCLEAMACGIPVITTDFGGQTDFVNNENGWIIPTTPIEANDIMYEGIKWGMPDIEKAKEVLKEIYSKPEIIKQKSIKAIETASKFTWRESAKKILEVIK